MSILDIKDLEIQFQTDDGCAKAVNKVNLSLEEGDTLGLVGETGAGKTTTALGIMRLISDPPGKYVGGEILFHGKKPAGDLRNRNEEDPGRADRNDLPGPHDGTESGAPCG